MGIYRIIGQGLSGFTGLFPLSLAELIVLIFFALIIFHLLSFIKKIYLGKADTHDLFRYTLNILLTLGILYFSFMILWGFHYHRLPFSDISDLDIRPSSIEELEALCVHLIDQTNTLRQSVSENIDGVTKIQGGYSDVFRRASYGYKNASSRYPELGGIYGKPKAVLLSKALSYAGISGIYFPFTGEANVNTLIPDSMLPCTTSHEMAHQRGFAREDEANYIAYLTCTLHPDPDFQYSGSLLALIYSMNALTDQSTEKYTSLRSKYSLGVKKDLQAIQQYWDKYEGPIEKASDRLNDAYLKANEQEAGVQSYGRMVDLLIAEFRKNSQQMISQ